MKSGSPEGGPPPGRAGIAPFPDFSVPRRRARIHILRQLLVVTELTAGARCATAETVPFGVGGKYRKVLTVDINKAHQKYRN
jgi:hypothetical protein